MGLDADLHHREKTKVGRGKMQLIPSCQQWILKIISWHTQLCANHNSVTVTFSFHFTRAGKSVGLVSSAVIICCLQGFEVILKCLTGSEETSLCNKMSHSYMVLVTG